MKRPNGSTALLTLFLGLSLVSLALARSHRDTPALPRLVATVISLDSRGLATIRTEDGATYLVISVKKEQILGRRVSNWCEG